MANMSNLSLCQQYKKVQKSSWNEPYSSFSFTKQFDSSYSILYLLSFSQVNAYNCGGGGEQRFSDARDE